MRKNIPAMLSSPVRALNEPDSHTPLARITQKPKISPDTEAALTATKELFHANGLIRQGGANNQTATNCQQICSQFRPNGLPSND